MQGYGSLHGSQSLLDDLQEGHHRHSRDAAASDAAGHHASAVRRSGGMGAAPVALRRPLLPHLAPSRCLAVQAAATKAAGAWGNLRFRATMQLSVPAAPVKESKDCRRDSRAVGRLRVPDLPRQTRRRDGVPHRCVLYQHLRLAAAVDQTTHMTEPQDVDTEM